MNTEQFENLHEDFKSLMDEAIQNTKKFLEKDRLINDFFDDYDKKPDKYKDISIDKVQTIKEKYKSIIQDYHNQISLLMQSY